MFIHFHGVQWGLATMEHVFHCRNSPPGKLKPARKKPARTWNDSLYFWIMKFCYSKLELFRSEGNAHLLSLSSQNCVEFPKLSPCTDWKPQSLITCKLTALQPFSQWAQPHLATSWIPIWKNTKPLLETHHNPWQIESVIICTLEMTHPVNDTSYTSSTSIISWFPSTVLQIPSFLNPAYIQYIYIYNIYIFHIISYLDFC